MTTKNRLKWTNITWNAPGWPAGDAPIELVDGKQRLEAVRKFIRGDLEAYGDALRAWRRSALHPRVVSLSRLLA